MKNFDKLIISAGHNAKRTGASALGRKEHHLTSVAAQELTEALQKLGVNVEYLSPLLSLSERVQKVTAMGSRVLAIELHFNVFNHKADGSEMFYVAGDKQGFDFGSSVLRESCEALGLKNRGMKLASSSARGSLAWLKIPQSLLWEICFMDVATDMALVLPLGRKWASTVAPLMAEGLL